jgi:5'-nucleotidase/UDP-sugar diphosphatase
MNIARRTLLGALATLPMIRIARGDVARRLTVLHVNDIHSRHEPVDARALTCAPGARPDCFGSTARLASALFAERAAAEAAGREVMLLDAGDQFQGSLFYTAWHGEVELAVMHAFGTEAMAVGNHEFDNGPKTLADFVRGAKFPVLSANIDASADPDLAGLLRPSVLRERAGVKIGIVGLTTQQAATGSSPGPNIRFTDPAEALAREAAALRRQGAHLVLALSHLGVAEDEALAGHVPGVDVFIGGHSHTLLSDSEAGAAGPAHATLTGPSGRAVVVQAACYARYFGRLDLDLDANGRILAVGGDARHVGLDLPEHPGVAKIVASYAAQLDTVRHRVVGRTAGVIDVTTCRIGECALGSFVAEAVLASVRGADIALFNAGGLRTGLPEGEITIGDVLSVLPFGNTVANVRITGAELRTALANGVARAGMGGFAQIAGMRLTWNPLAPATDRLRRVEIRQQDGSFAPLDPTRLYTLATNNFLRTGGDGYTVLRDRGRDAYDTGPGVDEVVEQALARIGTLAPTTDGRITVE